MALFSGQKCTLCGVTMGDSDQLFANGPCFGIGSLALLNDSVVHWDCYAKWRHRARFARRLFGHCRRTSGCDSYWGVALADDHVLVTVNPDERVSEIDVMQADTGSSLRIALTEWKDWLACAWRESCHHDIEREALARVLPSLRSRLPTAEDVVAAAGVNMEAGVSSAPCSPEELVDDDDVSREILSYLGRRDAAAAVVSAAGEDAGAESAVAPGRAVTGVTCPACGFQALPAGYGSYEFCDVCDWEDDGVQLGNPTTGHGANTQSLAEAQAAILRRIPLGCMTHGEYRRDPCWRPLNAAELAEADARRAVEPWHAPAVVARTDAYWLQSRAA